MSYGSAHDQVILSADVDEDYNLSLISKLLLPTEKKKSKVWQCQIWDCHHRPHWIYVSLGTGALPSFHTWMHSLAHPVSAPRYNPEEVSHTLSFALVPHSSTKKVHGTLEGQEQGTGMYKEASIPIAEQTRFVLCVCVRVSFGLFCLG